MSLLTLEEILEADEFIRPFIRKTPLEVSPKLAGKSNSVCYLKLENLQCTGSFKLRGALFALSRLLDKAERSVITSSAGNHGWALAWAGKKFGFRVRIVVPSSADEAKCSGMRALGAEVITNPTPGYDEAEKAARDMARSQGIPFISPYDDAPVMAGNGGTVAAEILSQLPDIDNILFPVGGGGLGAGITSYLRRTRPEVKLIACQHLESPALELSLQRGKAVTELPPVETIAGGIEGGIGVNTFAILKDNIDQVVLVTEDELKASIIWLIRHHQYLVEAAGAATLAACLYHPDLVPPGNSVLVLSGRNIDIKTLASLLPTP